MYWCHILELCIHGEWTDVLSLNCVFMENGLMSYPWIMFPRTDVLFFNCVSMDWCPILELCIHGPVSYPWIVYPWSMDWCPILELCFQELMSYSLIVYPWTCLLSLNCVSTDLSPILELCIHGPVSYPWIVYPRTDALSLHFVSPCWSVTWLEFKYLHLSPGLSISPPPLLYRIPGEDINVNFQLNPG